MGKCGFAFLKWDRDGCHKADGPCELAVLYARF